MPLIEWTDKLSVRVTELDAQHRKLVDMLNGLHDAMSRGQGRETMGALLTSLIQYTGTHFADEERRMRQAAYPGLLSHKAEHDEFVRKVSDLKKRFEGGSFSLTVETMSFLKGWLTNHIQGTDKKYAPYLSAGSLTAVR